MAIGQKTNGTLKYSMVPFVQCKAQDFEMLPDKSFLNKIDHRLCPDFDTLKDMWQVAGSYSNQLERYHVHIDVTICNKDRNPNCKESPLVN